MTQGTEDLVIAVLTYKRPEDLSVALPRLVEQAKSVSIGACVMVVDNDPLGGAEDAVTNFGSPLVHYFHEPRPGIAAARNRAMAEASDRPLLVFIDDDEVPSEHWLRDLLALYRSTGAAAIVGPVISEYASAPEPWISGGRFFDRRRLSTGTPLSVAATNNLLLDLEQIRRFGLDFDERFGLSGGSDTLFTRKLVRLGGRMVWCDEAVVVDRVPDSRLSRGWVLRRAFRSGNGNTRVNLELSDSTVERATVRAKGLAAGGIRVIVGCMRFVAGMLTASLSLRARGLRTLARGAGMASGAVGYVYSEYRRE